MLSLLGRLRHTAQSIAAPTWNRIRTFATQQQQRSPPPPEAGPHPPETFLGFIRIPKFLLKQAIVASPNFNRWLIPPCALSMHLCIGSVYAWSIFNQPLTQELGGVVSAADDWELSRVVPCFSAAIICLGVSAAVASTWLERVGPRCVGTVAACCWAGGHAVASFGVYMHCLPLVVLGYGVLGGCGLGLGYVSPVSTLLRWFPDRRGMAAGLAVAGFGGGAIFAAPLNRWLLGYFRRAPEYVGDPEELNLVTEAGRRFVKIGDKLREVVVATHADLAAFPGLKEGAYLVGTGCSGVTQTFLTLSAVYFAVMITSAMAFRVPADHWVPKGWTPPVGNTMISSKNVLISSAVRTPQFALLWIALGCNITAGIAIIGSATTMIRDILATTMPDIATPSFCASYVSSIAVASIVGRLFWSSLSDYIGRKTTFALFFGLGVPLYLSIPTVAHMASVDPSIVPVLLFYASTMVIFSMYGGGFATVPAYLADLFGTKFVGGIHGRLLTTWSCAGVAGPLLLTYFRNRAQNSALHDLAFKVDPVRFEHTFGTSLTPSNLDVLIQAKTVTIPQLMLLVPPNIPDPTPFMYNDTMYAMATLLSTAFVANALIQPVDSEHHMEDDHHHHHPHTSDTTPHTTSSSIAASPPSATAGKI